MNHIAIRRDIKNVIDSSLRIKAATTFASEYLKKQDALESFEKDGLVVTNLNDYFKTKNIEISINTINNYFKERQDLVESLIKHIFENGVTEINIYENYKPGSPGSKKIQEACRNMTYYLYFDLVKDKISHTGTNYFKIVLMVLLVVISSVLFVSRVSRVSRIKKLN